MIVYISYNNNNNFRVFKVLPKSSTIILCLKDKNSLVLTCFAEVTDSTIGALYAFSPAFTTNEECGNWLSCFRDEGNEDQGDYLSDVFRVTQWSHEFNPHSIHFTVLLPFVFCIIASPTLRTIAHSVFITIARLLAKNRIKMHIFLPK